MQTLTIVSGRQGFDELDASIREAHRTGDLKRIATSYAQSGTLFADLGKVDEACFFWTQAYVFALDAGAEKLAKLMHDKLNAFNRMG